MSLAAKPTWTSRARVEEFAQMRNAAENLRVLAEWLATPNYMINNCITMGLSTQSIANTHKEIPRYV